MGSGTAFIARVHTFHHRSTKYRELVKTTSRVGAMAARSGEGMLASPRVVMTALFITCNRVVLRVKLIEQIFAQEGVNRQEPRPLDGDGLVEAGRT